MSKPLICLIGVSGSGKSAIANKAERKYGYTQVKSYTTRSIRLDDEKDHLTHTFITFADVDKYRDEIVASNTYNNHFYFATRTILNANDIYVVDGVGLKQLRDNYKDKKIKAIYIDVPPEIAAERMEHRGDSNDKIMERLQYDQKAFEGVKEQCDYVCSNLTQNDCNDIVDFIDMLMRYSND